MSDDDLIDLKKIWEKSWNEYYKSKLRPRQERAEKYWLGLENKQANTNLNEEKDKPVSDNLIFEAVETFLPIATKSNPEPVVLSDDTPEGLSLADKVKKVLSYQADVNKLKLKIKQAVRFWALYFVGVVKVSWSEKRNDMIIKVIRPQKLILDPEAIIEECEYTGDYIGEYKKDSAEILIQKFPNKAKLIKDIAQDKLSTQIQYIEWWTPDILFWTLKDEVLGKVSNPNWNGDIEEDAMEINEYGDEVPILNEEGEVMVNVSPGRNHFAVPKIPYVFLSVFNLMKHPHDDTSLIEQNLANQDIINKRQKQIDDNVDDMNGGWVISLSNAGLSKEEATLLAYSLRNGGSAIIPSGVPRNAIDRVVGTGLPSDIFNNLADTRNELRGIFGTTGLSAPGIREEQTVRGKILSKGSDADRIGGGVTEYIEQFADAIFNWMTQMIYVYYGDEHSFPILGSSGGSELVRLKSEDLDKQLLISVKEGSLVPRDSLTKRNEAVDLWSAGALDPVTLFERLEFPNPQESAEKLVAWQQGQLLQQGQQQQGQVAMQEQPIEVQPNLLAQAPIQ